MTQRGISVFSLLPTPHKGCSPRIHGMKLDHDKKTRNAELLMVQTVSSDPTVIRFDALGVYDRYTDTAACSQVVPDADC